MGGIYEVRLSEGLRCHAKHTQFHKYCFRHSKVDSGDSQTAWISRMPVLGKQADKKKNPNLKPFTL
jgi:hypothetical protein